MLGILRIYVCWALAFIAFLSLISSFYMPLHHIPVKDTSNLGKLGLILHINTLIESVLFQLLTQMLRGPTNGLGLIHYMYSV